MELQPLILPDPCGPVPGGIPRGPGRMYVQGEKTFPSPPCMYMFYELK